MSADKGRPEFCPRLFIVLVEELSRPDLLLLLFFCISCLHKLQRQTHFFFLIIES